MNTLLESMTRWFTDLRMKTFDKIIAKGNQKRDLKEIHLVSFLSWKITQENALFPKKAFYVNFNNKITLEENFRFSK